MWAALVCLLGVMVDNSVWYHEDVTIFNFTAVEYHMTPSNHRHRVVEMGLCTLTPDSPLQFQGRYHHLLQSGRFHMCMMSGVLASLQRDATRCADHEPPLVDASLCSFSEELARKWLAQHQATYGLVTAKPSKPFTTGTHTEAQKCMELWSHCREWGLPAEVEAMTLDGFCRYSDSTEEPPQPDMLHWEYSQDQFTICAPRAVC